MQKQLIGSVVGGAVSWIVGYVVFGLIMPMVFPGTAMPIPDTTTMVEGYLVGVVALFLAAQAMSTIGGGATRQVTKLFWIVAGVLVSTRIGDAVWEAVGHPMRTAVFKAAGEALCLVAGGYVMARWFLTSDKAA